MTIHGEQEPVDERVVRLARASSVSPVDIAVPRRGISVRGINSPMLILYGFVVVDLIGAALLTLPISSKESVFTHFVTALFTATSAVTVTGLATVDTHDYWNHFGQVVIMVLIFVGGLGFMTGAAFLIIILGQQLGLGSSLIVREGVGTGQLGNITGLVRNIVLLAVIVQFIGFMVLWVYWTLIQDVWDGGHFSTTETLWQSLFHVVAAFNNAGMDILPDNHFGGPSLEGFKNDYGTIVIISVLIMFGGFGYIVIRDLWVTKGFHPLSLDTKMVVVGTAALIPLGVFSYLLGEWSNPLTSGHESVPVKIADATFHSIGSRSAGFNIVPYAGALAPTDLATSVLMFIGAASGSTGGGIKISTFMILLFSVVAILGGRSTVNAFGRRVPSFTVQRAFAVALVSVAIVVLGMFVIGEIEEDAPFREVLFEVISAFGTVGLSTGLSERLTHLSQVVMVVMMFVGRLGPLALGLSIAGLQAEDRYTLAEEEVRIG